MSQLYTQDKRFEKINFLETELPTGEYDGCRFVGCQFANADLSHSLFSECTFDQCNFSLTKLSRTAFRAVQFTGCELLGLHFDTCNEFLFTVGYEQCVIRLSSFHKLKLKKTVFRNCDHSPDRFHESRFVWLPV